MVDPEIIDGKNGAQMVFSIARYITPEKTFYFIENTKCTKARKEHNLMVRFSFWLGGPNNLVRRKEQPYSLGVDSIL